MTSPLPLISVVVFASNDERDVQAALESVYEQDQQPLELVVLDDRSQDRTAAIVRDYLAQGRVQSRFRRAVLVESGESSGTHALINRGVQESQGQYVGLLQANERFARGRLTALVNACTAAGGQLAFTRVDPFGDDTASSSAEIEHVYSVQDNIEFFPTVGYGFLRYQCALSSGNLFFSRALFDRVGKLANLKHCAVWDFVLRALALTEPLFIREPLYLYRVVGQTGFLEQQKRVAAEAERIVDDYLVRCRTRPSENALAPSPAWGPFFASFVQASRRTRPVTR